jgi:hypothetical protein
MTKLHLLDHRSAPTTFRRSLARGYPIAAAIALMIGVAAPQARATVFQAAGTFSDGATLSGSITIDTLTGTVTSSALTITGSSQFYFDTVVSQQDFGTPLFYTVLTQNPSGQEAFLLGIPLDSLVSYAGGEMCDDSIGTCLSSVYYAVSLQNPVSLMDGTLSVATQDASEPTLLTAWGLGSVALFLFTARRRKVKTAFSRRPARDLYGGHVDPIESTDRVRTPLPAA